MNASKKTGTPPKTTQSLSAAEIVAAGLGALWLLGSATYFLWGIGAEESAGFATTVFVIFLPVALFWVAAFAARSSRIMREEAERLHIAIDALRQTYVSDRQSRPSEHLQPTVEKKLDEIARTARKTETALATFTTSRNIPRTSVAPQQPVPSDDQPSLALGTTLEDTLPPLSRGDLIRALNFPDTKQDEVGFSALRKALRDRNARQLVQASQDVLTLLSQDGIYMDDMRPDLARPEVWRRFANGERGRSVAALGGIRDRSSLALTAGRMREDTIFRDAAHHFLRRFDKTLVSLEAEISDEELMALAETRTARAFMLLGRVTGAFD